MPRKRKIAITVPVDEDEENMEPSLEKLNTSKSQHGPMYTILSNAQMNETFHKKYIKEMRELYKKMDHDAFMFTFIKMIQCAMAAEEANEYAQTTLIFCAKYIASYDDDETHPTLKSIFQWLLTTISNNPHIRYRLCQFVNMVLNALGFEAALDDTICDNISAYMVDRLRDMNPNVRVQAILALQRLQMPDNPDDVVLKAYQFHLSSDPSPRVRMAVITSMGRNYNTIPYILDRLWDVDEKVRRHTYFHMSSYTVKSYKVAQRLTFLEQGLNDRSDLVRKVVLTVMLPQWLESYGRDYLQLTSALKLDANEVEIERFRKVAKLALTEMFKSKRQKVEELIKTVPLEDEGEFARCVRFEDLSVEVTLFWYSLIDHLQQENSDEVDNIIPELTTFCNYIRKYYELSSKTELDKWQRMEHQYILLTLMEIVSTFDLGDEIGRENLKQLLEDLLKNADIGEPTIRVIVQCTENLMPKLENRLQFFVDIVRELSDTRTVTNELSHDRTLIDELIEKYPEKKNLKFAISTLKVKMLDLEEQETNFVQKKDYAQAQIVTEKLNECKQEYRELLKPILKDVSDTGSEESRRFNSLTLRKKKLSPEVLTKLLQITYYMVVSKKVNKLTPNVCEIYKDFIRRHIESNQTNVRLWALRCGTAYSMLYEPFAKDVYTELHSQFYKNHNTKLWKAAIEGVFELLDRYGCSHFDIEDKHNKSRKAGRQLYNTLEAIDADDEPSTNAGMDLIFLMSHFLDTCDDMEIINGLVKGFCRLILHGHIKNDDIMEKMVLSYFNPTTVPEINQYLGVFFENLIKRKKQELLQPCLLPTIHRIQDASYDSPLYEIKPETVLRFVIDSTRPIYCNSGSNIHNTIAMSFLREMQNSISNKDFLKILAKELVTLEVATGNNSSMQKDLKEYCEKLLECDLDQKTAKCLRDFRDILDGTVMPGRASEQNTRGKGGSDEEIEEESDDEQENRNTIVNETVPERESQTTTTLQGIPEESEQEETARTPNKSNLSTENLPQPPSSASKDKEDEEAGTEKEKLPEEPTSEQSGPTTFGEKNTTNLRYLRKSMNVLQRGVEEQSPKKAKLRSANEKTPKTRAVRSLNGSPQKSRQQSNSKKIAATNNSSTESKESEANSSKSPEKLDISKTNQERAEKPNESRTVSSPVSNNVVTIRSVEGNKSTIAAVDESADELEPLILSESETSTKHDENSDSGSESEVVDASVPDIERITTTLRTRRATTKFNSQENTPALRTGSATKKNTSKTSANKSASRSKTIEKVPPASSKPPATPTITTKRRQNLFNSPNTAKGDNDFVNSPIRKQPRKTLQLSDNQTNTKQTQQKPQINANIKQANTNIVTPNTERRIRTSKNPILKVNRVEPAASNPHRTRTVVRKEFLMNTIMTRRTVSNSPIRKNRIQASSTPSRVSKDNVASEKRRVSVDLEKSLSASTKKNTRSANVGKEQTSSTKSSSGKEKEIEERSRGRRSKNASEPLERPTRNRNK